MNLGIYDEVNLKSSSSCVRWNYVDLLGTGLINNLSFTAPILDSKV